MRVDFRGLPRNSLTSPGFVSLAEVSVPESRTYDGVYPAPDMLSLLDGSVESCIVAPPSGQLNMRIFSGDAESSSLTVDATLKIAAPCTSTDITFKMFTPVEQVTKVKMCTAQPVAVSGDVHTWRFTCTCSQGHCQKVEVRAFGLPSSDCTFLCEIAYTPTDSV